MLVVFYKNIPEMGQEIIQMNGGRIWGVGLLYAHMLCAYICLRVCINTYLYTYTHVLWIGNHLHSSNINSCFLSKGAKHWKHQLKTEPHQSAKYGQGGRTHLYFSTLKYKNGNFPSQAKGKVALSTSNHIFPTKNRRLYWQAMPYKGFLLFHW